MKAAAQSNLVVINAPVAGQVRRVLVREGAHVSEGTAIIEIAVRASDASGLKIHQPISKGNHARQSKPV